MRYSIILILSLLFTAPVNAQHPSSEDGALSITATGEIQLPADQIQFHININAEADTPQQAYELHQQREEVLVDLLHKFDIADEDIRYEPIAISKHQSYNRDPGEKPVYRTQQTVMVTLRDFDAYEQIQVALIENDYDNFSGSFSSTRLKEGQDQALREAIRQARRKAELMAEAADVTLGPVRELSYSHQPPQPVSRNTYAVKAESDAGSLLQYQQQVVVTATVTVRYALSQQ